MKRVFAVDGLKCSKCGSRRRWISTITEPGVICRILKHFDLPNIARAPTPPRSPPQLELGFEGSFGLARALTDLNSSSLDFCPSYSSDGELFCFTSHRTIPREGSGPWRSLQDLRKSLDSAGNGDGDVYWPLAYVLEG